MDIKERLENARYAIVEAERTVSELNFSVLTEGDYAPHMQLARACRRAELSMAKLRIQIDLATVTWGQHTAKG